MPYDVTAHPFPDYLNHPDIAISDQTVLGVFSALMAVGVMTEQQVDDACDQMIYWRQNATA